MHKLIFGCGYLGSRVAQKWREAGHRVTVVTRRKNHAANLSKDGYDVVIADVTQPATLQHLPDADTVLFAVGFDRTSSPSIHDVYTGGVRNVLAMLPAGTSRFIYISTTGVYGPAEGEWVDEVTPPNPRREGGLASLAAESELAASEVAKRSAILRLAGIYGPGRVPFLKELKAGEPIAAPATGWLNLIHVDDAAGVVNATSMLPEFNDGPRLYCVSDGQPVQRGEYYSEVARQVGAPPPHFVEPNPDSPRAARAEANRRISNARMLADLRVTLTYPDYRSGLVSAVET